VPSLDENRAAQRDCGVDGSGEVFGGDITVGAGKTIIRHEIKPSAKEPF
jgi:hypothetical protein